MWIFFLCQMYESDATLAVAVLRKNWNNKEQITIQLQLLFLGKWTTFYLADYIKNSSKVPACSMYNIFRGFLLYFVVINFLVFHA